MVPDCSQPEERPRSSWAIPALLSLTAALCAGCANPGPPKPPSLHLPQLVKDLSAERAGNHVLLRWTTPSRTTDDMEIKGTITAEVCRETDPKPSTPAARLTACAPLSRVPVAPGPSELIDTLPGALQANPVKLLTYRIQIFNSTGRSAGESTMPAFAAAGQAPPPVESLQPTAVEQGAILEWRNAISPTGSPYTVDIKRTDLSTAPKTTASAPKQPKPEAIQPKVKPKSNQPKKQPTQAASELLLRAMDVTGAKNQMAGAVDTTAAMGDTYNYTAQRVRDVKLGVHQLEIKSDPSAVVTLVLRDTFPPKPPTGLATISGNTTAASASAQPSPQPSPYIDLSWEPNGESDLAGYRVYRQLARPDGTPQGPLARLTAVPIAAPAYRDVAVKPGQGYIYSVTAVDAAGNESAPSAKALEVTPSD